MEGIMIIVTVIRSLIRGILGSPSSNESKR